MISKKSKLSDYLARASSKFLFLLSYCSSLPSSPAFCERRRPEASPFAHRKLAEPGEGAPQVTFPEPGFVTNEPWQTNCFCCSRMWIGTFVTCDWAEVFSGWLVGTFVTCDWAEVFARLVGWDICDMALF